MSPKKSVLREEILKHCTKYELGILRGDGRKRDWKDNPKMVLER